MSISTDGVDTGFRTANLIRIIGKEDGLLSLSNDEPRVYMNFEDYIGPNLVSPLGMYCGVSSVKCKSWKRDYLSQSFNQLLHAGTRSRV